MSTKFDAKDYHCDPSITTYMGVYIGQLWADLELWERFLNLYPVKCIIELGTSNGGMSLFLANEALRLGAAFHTFDNQAFVRLDAPLAHTLPIKFHCVDLWGAGAPMLRQILDNAALHPLVLFCDDGDKPREWATFGPWLRAGDYIAVHDWPYEFGPQHLGALPVEPVLAAECASRESITRWYRIGEPGRAT